MANFQDQLNTMIASWDNILGGVILVFLLVGIGLFFTFQLHFVQIVQFKRAFKLMFGGIFHKQSEGEGALSSFQALATAVAAQIGTGNVGGVAVAISIGGPGALFWMWVTALVGMATIFAEAVLAQFFREKRDGEYVGGPAFYISKGVGRYSKGLGKFLAGFFAVAIILALGLSGNMVQSNSIATSLQSSFGIPQWVVGIALAVIAGLIFIGGVKRIGRFAETVVPFMAVLYVLGSIILLILFAGDLGRAFHDIFVGAFSPQAAFGGVAGATIRMAIKQGVQRGLFSNEAGMGSTPHAHAVAQVPHPAEQGLMALVGVFVDTIVVCTATGLAVVSAETYLSDSAGGPVITMNAFAAKFGVVGGPFVAICLMFFAFTTIVGWYYFGETNVKYLFGKNGLTPYRVLVLLAIFAGSLAKLDLVWTLNGFLNNLMVIPNVIALLLLSPLVVRIYKDYSQQLKNGEKLHFDRNNFKDYDV